MKIFPATPQSMHSLFIIRVIFLLAADAWSRQTLPSAEELDCVPMFDDRGLWRMLSFEVKKNKVMGTLRQRPTFQANHQEKWIQQRESVIICLF